MQFESLKVFCDIARHRSFSRAAAVNAVTQSAASQVVLQLEKRLGVKLIDRSTRPLQLTHEGQVYYEGCKGLVERYLELETTVRSLPGEIAPSVQIAAIYSVGLGDMSHYVQRFRELAPNVQVHIEYLHPDRVYENVLDGTADLGLVSFPRKSRDLVAIPWRQEEMVLACHPEHRFAKQKSVRPSQLADESYITFNWGLVIRREVDRFLRDHGVSVQVVHEFDNIENIKKAIEVGAGVALLPLPTLQREIESASLCAIPLSNCRFVRPLAIIHRRGHRLNAGACRFIELLRQPKRLRAKRAGAPGNRSAHLGQNASRNGGSGNSNGRGRSSRRTV